MKIIVFGASGGTGHHFVEQALQAGHEVSAFVRSSARIEMSDPKLQVIVGDACDPIAVKEAVASHDAVVVSLGVRGSSKSLLLSEMTGNIMDGMRDHGINRVLYVAAAGIYNEIPGIVGMASKIFLRHVLADHRSAVERIKSSHAIWTIARPLHLIDTPLTGKYRATMQGVPVGGQKIARADVAHFLLHALSHERHERTSVGLAY
ncbi:SDR family oxidoreductase [Paenibacillus sp. N1-5-1-14]|uniref:NAD(P)-dependent oxidoreductase n=1 Tax=Paenibacillus radicibacter TaxID=2972488 RepID=UPI002159480D|nr:NAD(P)-binding oxidoreductase [Paenibacillus radicibacter]MCR8643548.1 SDR family oxidoreductase [Paenibacillus radicibacter]